MSVISLLKVVLINTFTEKITNLYKAVLCIVADYLALDCRGNVNLDLLFLCFYHW